MYKHPICKIKDDIRWLIDKKVKQLGKNEQGYAVSDINNAKIFKEGELNGLRIGLEILELNSDVASNLKNDADCIREIKYKAWNRLTNQMCLVRLIRYADDGYHKTVGVYLVGDTKLYIHGEDCLLLQYTDRYDKNNKEVYDGDILEYDGFWGLKVEYEAGCFWIRDLHELKHESTIINLPIHEFALHNWQVIGNIYENPELLEIEDDDTNIKQQCESCNGRGYEEYPDYDWEENLLDDGIRYKCEECNGKGYTLQK